ncbi:MAG: hypothetical protein N4A43_02445 [Alphaproteobacteria bacterium]|jgi:hypothetical protein|nr:hypothetical protein [Alphaproteobacteria bacterium]
MSKKKMGASVRAYAEHRGISHTAVQKAINSGRISTFKDGSINISKADEEWDNNTDFSKVRNAKPKEYAIAQTVKMKAEATNAQLDLQERLGKVIPREEVLITFGVLMAELTNSLIMQPQRISPKLYGKSISEMVSIIKRENQIMIKEFNDGFEERIIKKATKIMDAGT